MNRPVASLLLIVSSLIAPAGRMVNAQGVSAARSGFSVTPYVWMSSLDGRIGVGPLAANVDLGFDEIVKKLKFAFMATGELRRGKWVGFIDGVYVSLGDAGAVAFRGDTGSFALTQRETIIQPMGGYTVRGESWAIDLLGGLRYWNLSTTLDVDRSRRSATTTRSGIRDWVDAIAGVSVHWLAKDKLRLAAGADGGGGGSRGSWQAYGSLGFDVWRKVSLGAAYRVLSVNYDRRDFLFDTDTKGFILDATFHF